MAWTRFDDHLARLSRSERTAFVAALLAARGWAVEVEPPVVVATKGDQRRVVAVAREGFVPGHGLPAESVDVVVGIDSDRTERLATARDAHAWDARALYDMARYGLDDDVTRRLFAEHFGVTDGSVSLPTPGDDTPETPRSSRDPSTDDAGTRRTRRLAVLLLAVLLLVGPPLTILGVTGTPSDDTGSDRAEDSDTHNPNRNDGDRLSPSPSRTAEPTLVAPGLSASSITDTPALARAHATVLSDRSFTMHIRYTERVDTETVGTAQEVVHVENGTVYRSRGARSGNLSSSLVPVIARDIYADGEGRYLQQETGALRVGGAADPGTGQFVERSRALVVWYLSGADSSVIEQAPRGDRVYYSVEVTGDSDRRIEDYRAIAVITNQGLVVQIDAQYRLPESGRVATVSLRHVNVGTTTVERPAWMPPRNESTG